MTTDPNRVSLLPSDAVVGGALGDIDATIERARFGAWDYRGKADPTCALLVTFRPKGNEDETLPDHYTQAYSCGPLEKYTPSDDGTYVIASGSAKGFNKSSNVIMFLTALLNKGYPEAELGKNDISLLDGMEVHLVQVSQPKREGLRDQPAEAKSITLIDRIIAMPGEGSGAKAPAGAKTAPAAKAKVAPATKAPATTAKAKGPSASDPDIVASAHSHIMAIVLENGGKATKAEIAGKIFKALASESDVAVKNATIQAAYKDETLKSGPWSFDGTTVTMG